MKNLGKGKDRVQEICDVIRLETLEPAEREAHRIIAEGERAKQTLIAEGKEQKELLIAEGRAAVEQEKNVFRSSLNQAMKLALEELKQRIEEELFQKELQNVTQQLVNTPSVVARLADALVDAIERSGLKANLSLEIAQQIDPEELSHLLAKKTLQRLGEGSIVIGAPGQGGVTLALHEQKMAVSITGNDLKKMLAEHIHKDFRALVFTP